MLTQADMFDHPINARLSELRRKMNDHHAEINKMQSEVQELTSRLTKHPVSMDGSVNLMVGPGGKLFLTVTHESNSVTHRAGAREFFPVSLDLLVRSVGELTKENHYGPKAVFGID